MKNLKDVKINDKLFLLNINTTAIPIEAEVSHIYKTPTGAIFYALDGFESLFPYEIFALDSEQPAKLVDCNTVIATSKEDLKEFVLRFIENRVAEANEELEVLKTDLEDLTKLKTHFETVL